MRVVLAGASGLVGQELRRELMKDPTVTAVTSLVRRASSNDATLAAPTYREQVVAFDALPLLEPHDAVLIALGTTMKKAGSKAAFRAVDYDAVLAVAKVAREAGATRVGVVSSVGASPQSRAFYTRTKGEAEEALKALGFPTTVIARPSILDGDRQESRPGERVGLWLARSLAFAVPPRYRAIHVKQVAKALWQAVRSAEGLVVLESEALAAC
jgi:uncharacterized protein YbjT (DUF2867 family)